MAIIKISFCTVVKNRLHHLKKTLTANIFNNLDYEALEFVILDYNSSDGVANWLISELGEEVANGRVKLFRTEEPEHFHRSHSRNMAFKLAEGDIICNVDADNFTGAGFAQYVSDVFHQTDNIFLSAFSMPNGNADCLGRICCRRNDFFKAGGYDERLQGYGFEDYDLNNKLLYIGLKEVTINRPEFLEVITHADEERISEEKLYKELKTIYVKHLSPHTSQIFYLLYNGSCQYGHLIDHTTIGSEDKDQAFLERAYLYAYSLEEAGWQNANWVAEGNNIIIRTDGNEKMICFSGTDSESIMEITDKEDIIVLVLFNTQFTNRNQMRVNTNEAPVPFPTSIGCGTVYKWPGKTPTLFH